MNRLWYFVISKVENIWKNQPPFLFRNIAKCLCYFLKRFIRKFSFHTLQNFGTSNRSQSKSKFIIIAITCHIFNVCEKYWLPLDIPQHFHCFNKFSSFSHLISTFFVWCNFCVSFLLRSTYSHAYFESWQTSSHVTQ